MSEMRPTARAIPAYILAGGASRRFGSDKARATFHGRPLIMTLSNQLVEQGFTVTVVGKRDDQYADLGLLTIGDIEPDQGPIGGLHTALTHRGEGWLLLCSCDMLEIDDRWVDSLLDELRRSPEADAITARDHRLQPFPGLYHTRLLQSAALREARSFQKLFERVGVCALAGEGLPPVRQINTKGELDAVDSARKGGASGGD